MAGNFQNWFVNTFFASVVTAAVKAEHTADITALHTAIPNAGKLLKDAATIAVKDVHAGQKLVAQGQAKISVGTATLASTQQLDCPVELNPKPVK